MPDDAIDFNALRRVLIIKLRHHGDVLLTSPMFTVLNNHYPHLEVDALVYHDTREMLTLHPHIAQIHTVGRDWRSLGVSEQWQKEKSLLGTLRERHYDLIIHLTDSWRGVWYCRLLAPRHAATYAFPQRSRRRIWRKSFSHRAVLHDHRRHTVEKHLDVLRRLGLQPDRNERDLTLVPGDEATSRVDAILKRHNLESGQFIHLHPTSRWLFKCWSTDGYAETIDVLGERGETIVITGAPNDQEQRFIEDILKRVTTDRVVDLSGQLSLKELAALTARAQCFVGVDSVPMHIAAAMKTPTVALFGPSGDQEWSPWQVRSDVLTSQMPCRPCGKDGCGGGKVSECLFDIPAPRVVAAIHSLDKRD